MNTVVYIEPEVWFRTCPGCGFIASQTAVSQMSRDISCPKCHQHKFSTFRPLDKHQEPVRYL